MAAENFQWIGFAHTSWEFVFAFRDIRAQMYFTLVPVLVTYIPLQLAAIWAVRHPITRLAAALPMLKMLPVIIGGTKAYSYQDGSLYGIVLTMIFTVSMCDLAIFLFSGLAFRLMSRRAK
jgi:hypothetical protein